MPVYHNSFKQTQCYKFVLWNDHETYIKCLFNFSFNWNRSPSTFYKHFYLKSSSLQSNYQLGNHASCIDSVQGSSMDPREALCAKLFLSCISELPLSAEPLRGLASSIAPSLVKTKTWHRLPMLWITNKLKIQYKYFTSWGLWGRPRRPNQPHLYEY